MRRIALVFVAFSILGAVTYLSAFSSRQISLKNMEDLQVAFNHKPKTTKLVFVGDIMLSRAIGSFMAEKKDYTFPFASTTDVIRSADIAFGNLESPISSQGVRSGSIYSFRADPKAVQGLVSAGFDVVSFANNHAWDYGKQAFLDTLSFLDSAGIYAVGAGVDYTSAHKPTMITVNDTTFAFLGYTNLLPVSLGGASSTPAVARYDDNEIVKDDIARAKELADVVIVSFHFGDEYETTHNAEQEHIAKLAIDSGASLVIGHHPHVVEEVEEYNGGYIFYSLGNFVFDQNFSADTKKGLLAEVVFQGTTMVNVTEREIAFTDDYQPYFTQIVEDRDAEI